MPVSVEGVSDIVQISADGETTCALQDTQQLWCWGGSTNGQLGTGTLDATCIPTNPTNLPLVDTFVVGDHYTFVLDENGQAWSWGDNDWGQLGDTTNEVRMMPGLALGVPALRSVGLGWHHTCATTQAGAAICWGCNTSGELGNGLVDDTFQLLVQVSGLSEGVSDAQAGFEHSCALLDNGKILCWGANDFGQLGRGSLEASLLPVPVNLP